ncbi:putative ATPase [Kluyveromyces lactis]|uniref:KLLA0E04159p n=1 Tax=Kluyveromyces lactis (strain ATCC 8585 / CBS 2359 / DSM 70799 / NBRC 1267 / NRRL Y-1140 / WM37) TaxID=284590 RepID=Q6CPK8_KLULA|nr:uncharacterized protein KLLA0_E04159g [Kluyveromyces lactis]CAG99218.1 KLLA0E04159p [Kluyveromyces lactis]|eukprot:XP_454131.1 uncharacterized protein KLLA0_E04159g [Kluyveromyces lactis]
MAMDIIQMMKRGSGARAKPVASYKEKSENDLTADVYLDSDSDTDVKDTTDEPIWLDGKGPDEDDDTLLDSDDSDGSDEELDGLIDEKSAGRKASSEDAAKNEDSDENFENDSHTISLKIKKLQEFVQQSQVYSSIIADTLLERAGQNDEDETPQKKKQKKEAIQTLMKRDEPKDEGSPSTSLSSSFMQPSFLKNCQLKPYQKEGLNWLITLYENGLNGILADEMGLGKTIQSIALLAFIYEMDTKGPFLIAAPLSTVENWMNEFARFAPDIPVLKYYNSEGQAARHAMMGKFFKNNKGEGVIITSYEIIIRDIELILSYQWKFLIVDEGHRLKNINCKLIRELKRINTSNRLLLTGTPLQNNLGELWSLLNFILPNIFSDFEIFNKWFDFSDLNLESSSEKLTKIINDELEKNLISNLHTILKPFLLRRLKKNVLAGSLPPKREYIITCPVTPLQKKYYKQALKGNLKQTIQKQAIKDFFTLNAEYIGTVSNKSIRDFIEWKLSADSQDIPNDNIGKMEKLYDMHIHKELLNKRLQNMMIQLRQIVNSTYLFYFPLLEPTDLTLENLLKTSGKLQVLQKLVPELIKKKHKVLIFSQFVSMLDLIEDWSELNNFISCRIDGSMQNNSRKEQIEEFSKKGSKANLFLLSTRAAGLGINLTAADSVIIFDSDWNPQVDLQAMDRAHRIGQTKPVIVYRLYCDNTIENVIMTRAVNKRKLEKLVIQMGKFNTLKKLAFNEQTFLKMNGSSLATTTKQSANKELVKELSQLLISNETNQGQADTSKIENSDDILEESEMKELLDRSPPAYIPHETQFNHIRLFETTTGFDN